MSIEFILNSFRDRISWPTMSAILKACGLPISQGWTKSISKLLEYEKENKSTSDFIDSLEKLETLYKEYSVVGNKSVRAILWTELRCNESIRSHSLVSRL
jgi:hypothetical protein